MLKVERLLGSAISTIATNMEINHHVQQALKAHVLFQRDKDYVVQGRSKSSSSMNSPAA